MFANPVFMTPGRIIFVQTRLVSIFFDILVQGFCPLKINSTQFPDGFRINNYSAHKAEKVIRKDIAKKEVQGLTLRNAFFNWHPSRNMVVNFYSLRPSSN